MMAASGQFLYLITELGNIRGRVPSNLSGTGAPFWEKVNLPVGKTPVDIRFRDGDIYVESSDGSLYKRLVGNGWQLLN